MDRGSLYRGTLLPDGGEQKGESTTLETDVKVMVEGECEKPTRATLVLRSGEMVFQGVEQQIGIGMDRIADISLGFVPPPFDEQFDEGIVLSCDSTQQVRLLLIQPIEISKRRFLIAFLSELIDGESTLLAHPTQRGQQETDEELGTDVLYAHPYELEFGGDGQRGTGERIRFSAIIHLDKMRLFYENERISGLAIRHLQSIGPPLTTELRVADDRRHTLLQRILFWEHNRQIRAIDRLTLDDDEKDVLRALHNSHSGRDRALISILDKPPEVIAEVLSSLQQESLIRRTGTGPRLTQRGHMLFTHEKL